MMEHAKSKGIGILGSTGSIGTQALEVIGQNPDKFSLELITAQNNVDLLISQARQFKPKHVVICNDHHYQTLVDALSGLNIQISAGHDALQEAATLPEIDVLLTAVVGYAGLLPTLKAIEKKKTISLANKETLVVAGELVMGLAKTKGVDIIPVDSEHSALFQCLVGEEKNPIEKLILTASGGPFRGMNTEQIQRVTKAQALKHPNWAMGAKITIDSASMMNKGLEVIEAKWLFNVNIDQVEVVVHPQSIIHSLVQFEDGSLKAQLGLPDMRLPIQYALGYPQRIVSNFERFNFTSYPSLTFEKPNPEVFRNLALAFEAAKTAGNMPCILNAANEIAVAEFLRDKIRFYQIPEIVEFCMEKMTYIASPTLEDYIETDRETRRMAIEYLN